MIVKKFQAASETEAVLKAQEELGSKAVVLNVKTVKQRGIMRLFKKDYVEITAALEEDEFIDGINKNKPTVASNATSGSGTAMTKKNISPLSSSNTSKVDYVADEKIAPSVETMAIEQKLDSLHKLLQSQILANSDNGTRTGLESLRAAAAENGATAEGKSEDNLSEGEKVVRERENTNIKFLKLIYNKLIDNEVNEKFADQIIGEIENSLKKESNIDSILAAVYQKIILKLGEPTSIELGDKTKVVFFIGPTGVGKTTTIAKVASKFKLEQYAKVAFITSDTYRIAAVDQLNTYASILDCPVSVVYSADELEDALAEYKDFDLIMIDTAGRSHKHEEQMEELAGFLEKMEELKDSYDVDIYLTLSVTTKYKDLVDITKRYSDVKNWAVIFTKLDETCCLGNILNIRMLTGAPLSYTTYGQNVPDDIEIINEQALAKQLLGGGA
ncbi:MAG: flagellar biosynthesis protein FlhF [Lachnospira sp.]|nr:flagellar biosynthesis protein FlhF [Lachnospira sp.]